MLINAPVQLVMIDGMDHFVPWSHPGLIKDAILDLLGTVTVK
jgi:pimeloyl-ACP methyl ester carboxylesterase